MHFNTRTTFAFVFWLSETKNLRVSWDFPSYPVVRSWSDNAGDTGFMSYLGTRIPYAVGQLSPRTTTTKAHVP